MKITLKEIVQDTFTQDEITSIPQELLDQEFTLNHVNDIHEYIKNCENESQNFKIAGEERINDWEKGWSGDGVFYSDNKNIDNLPYYFKNNTHIRVGRKIYEDISGFSEVYLLRALQAVIFNAYMVKFNTNTIIEYGCGTGSNISFLKGLYINYSFYGADWAQSACNKLVENKIVEESNSIKVDYFDSSTFMAPKENNVIFTNASLEQTGLRYQNFMNFLFKSQSVVGGIHIEPIRDLLTLDTDLNIQSYKYAEKRGYLTDFYSFMKDSSAINILEAKDYGIGSKYISGYQVIVWKKA
ncbi:hypothetical protein OAI73_00905 [Gammaproteobacteria bacterium]|nr:hypothetical protein [Gammaproteobacteria bacterium]